MAYFDDDSESPSMDHMSGVHDPINDRLRLGRELARDFQSTSFSSASSRGHHNNNKNNNNHHNHNNHHHHNDDDSCTLDSFDISNDAAAMSTRRLDMLQQTPTIDTQLLDQFPDFSMAGHGIAEDSMEIGRAGNGNKGNVDDSLRSVEFSSQQPFSIGGSTKRSDRRLFSTLPSPDTGRNLSFSSTRSDPSEILHRRGTTANNKGKEKARAQSNLGGQRLGSITNFDLSQIEISTPKNNRARSQGGTKITDFVSNSGSGGSRSRFADLQRSLEFDDDESASDDESISVRPRPFAGSSFAGSPKPRQPAATNGVPGVKRAPRVPETKKNDLTHDLPAIVAKSRKQPPAKIPQNFKSTDAFLHELGLDGNTTTTDLKNRLNQLKDVNTCKGDNTTMGITQQSYLLPQMSDLSELISGYPGDVTRMSYKRGPFNNTRGHKPIESIPIPHDERAILMAMRLLQDKVADLESHKAEAEHRCTKLQDDLRKSETRVRLEQQKTKSAEENLTGKRSGDSAFGGSDDGDPNERLKEKYKLELQMDKLKLESTINGLHAQLDKLTRDLETAKIALRHMQEERNFAVNSVALAIASNEDLKASMEELKSEIERLKMENYEQGMRGEREREEWKNREERLRRKAKEAKESALLAQDVMKEAARRDVITTAAMEAAEQEAARVERREQRAREKEELKEVQKKQERAAMEEQARIEKELEEKREQQRVIEQKKKVEKMIERQLKDNRPDLLYAANPGGLLTSVNPTFIQSSKSRKGKERAIVLPKGARKHVTIGDAGGETVIHTPHEEAVIEMQNTVEQLLADDTVMSISVSSNDFCNSHVNRTDREIQPEEIKKIAREINAERRKRKAAIAAVNAVQGAAAAAEDVKSKKQTTKKKPAPKPVVVVSSETQTPGESSKKAAVPKKTVRIDNGKGVANPEEPIVSSSTTVKPVVSFDIAQTQTQAPPKKAKKTRLVKKVVFYYDEDTTQTIQLEKEVEEEVSEDENEALVDEMIKTTAAEEQEEKESVVEGLTAEFEEGLTQEPARPAPSDVPEVEIVAEVARPRSPVLENHTLGLPERIQRVANHLAEHDPEQCTVCARMTKLQIREHEQRMQNPLADIDNSMAIPAPALELASRKKGVIRIINGYEEEPTPRPSQVPKRQLSKIVRQLSDEFSHLKL